MPKPFDYGLQAGERNAVVRRLREYNQVMAQLIAASLTAVELYRFVKAYRPTVARTATSRGTITCE